MGGLFSFPLFQEPLWFSYYGPIRHSEASEALDAAIATHLQEIGAKSTIPIRSEIATELIVPVALLPSPFSYPDSETVKISFASTTTGRISLNSHQNYINSNNNDNISNNNNNDSNNNDNNNNENNDNKSTDDHSNSTQINTNTTNNSFNFEKNMKCEQIFPRPSGNKWILRFDFPDSTENGSVSARHYILSIRSDSSIVVSEDRLVIDGVTSIVSPIFTQKDDSGEIFTDGNCILCCQEPATVIAFPCRHCCMCRQCSEAYSTTSSHCPLCRAIIYELIECAPHH